MDSDEDIPKSDKEQNIINVPHTMNNVGGILLVLFLEKLNNKCKFFGLFSCLQT